MPEPIETVVSKRKRKRKLSQNLERSRPGRKRSRHAGALEVPSGERRDQVRGAEDVEQAAQGRASDAVQRRAVPGDLGLVDGEMR